MAHLHLLHQRGKQLAFTLRSWCVEEHMQPFKAQRTWITSFAPLKVRLTFLSTKYAVTDSERPHMVRWYEAQCQQKQTASGGLDKYGHYYQGAVNC